MDRWPLGEVYTEEYRGPPTIAKYCSRQKIFSLALSQSMLSLISNSHSELC